MVLNIILNETVIYFYLKSKNFITNLQFFRFYAKYQFPGVVGCIDCTHVALVAPKENEHIYVNRKKYHSLNVQLVRLILIILKFYWITIYYV